MWLGVARADPATHVVPCDPKTGAAALPVPGMSVNDIATKVHAVAQLNGPEIQSFPTVLNYVAPIEIGDGVAVVACQGTSIVSVTYIIDP